MEMKKKYVVKTKNSNTKSVLSTALFGVAVVFILLSGIWSFTFISKQPELAISVLILSFFLGACLIGISAIIKGMNKKYVVEEVTEEAEGNNNVSGMVSQNIKNELMAAITLMVKEEVKKSVAMAATTAQPKPAEPVIPVVPVMSPTPVSPTIPATPVVPVTPVEKPEPVKEAAPVKAAAPAKPVAPTLVKPAAKASDVSAKDENVGSNEWKCRVCGRVNKNYVGMCACGNHISENNAPVQPKVEEPVKPAEPVKPVKPIEEPVKGTPQLREYKPVKSAQPTEPPKAEEPVKPVEPPKAEEPAKGTPQLREYKPVKPTVASAISRPTVDNTYSKPVENKTVVMDDDDDDDDDTVLGEDVEKRVIGPVSDESKWTCKLCGRTNLRIVGTCECGNTRINNKTFASASNLDGAQGRVPEALRGTTRLVPKNDFFTESDEPKKPNLDDPTADDYDIAAARAAEEAELKAKADVPMPASSRVDTSTSTQISATEWKCNLCNRVNRNYIGTCACGNTRH